MNTTSKRKRSQQSPPESHPDPSKSKWAVWIPIVVSVMTLVGGGIGWGISQWMAIDKDRHQEALLQKEKDDARKERAAARAIAQKEKADAKADAQKAEDDRLLRSYLGPLRTKLQLSASVYDQLAKQMQSPVGVLEWYVSEVRQVGRPQLSLAFGLMTDLVQKNSEIMTLLDGYVEDALTPAFKAEASRFRGHANTYAIRFKALDGVIASGKSLPPWMAFPAGFPSAVEEEIAARQKHRVDPTGVGAKNKFERKFDVGVRLDGMTDPCNDMAPEIIRKSYPTATFQIVNTELTGRGFGAHLGEPWLCTVAVTVVDEY
jgi:hypothetical protein